MKRCTSQKRGRFAPLRCCLQAGHDGACNYVVLGVCPVGRPGPRPRLSQPLPVKQKRG